MATQVKFKKIAKDRLFYGQWQYCMSFHLDEVSVLKTLDHDYIDSVISRRKEWIEISRQRWQAVPVIGGSPAIKSILTRKRRDITDETVDNLHTLAEVLLGTNVPFKIVTSMDQAWVYTNNKILISQLSKYTILKYRSYTEAVISRPKDTIKLKDPNYTHRTYLKSSKLSKEQKNTLVSFFNNQVDNIRVSPALSGWLLTPFSRSQDYFFIDHNGESWLLLLSLVHPGITRKTIAIIPA